MQEGAPLSRGKICAGIRGSIRGKGIKRHGYEGKKKGKAQGRGSEEAFLK